MMKNINLRGLSKHGCKISKIQSKKQVEDEGARKPKYSALFQVSVGSGDGTWYTKDSENYSVTSSNAIKKHKG